MKRPIRTISNARENSGSEELGCNNVSAADSPTEAVSSEAGFLRAGRGVILQ